MSLSTILLAAIPLAWLVPNHYLPWLSAWQDGFALALLTSAAICFQGRVQIPRVWLAVAGVAAASVAGQWATGLISFGGDALLAILYIAAFLLAVVLGSSLITPDRNSGSSRASLDAVALGTLAAALGSVGIALIQWTGAMPLGLYGVDLPPGSRPFANVAQPNHLSTLAFLGLCAVAMLRETGRVRSFAFWAAASFLVAGMIMSASRTGWLQVLSLVLLAAWARRRAGARLGVRQAALLAAIYALGTWLWPWVNETLLLTGGRGVTQQIEGGVRWPLWLSLIDAVGREPIWGYGWQQMVLAQQAVALDHPSVLHHFEHSHNIVLDLMLWAGIPVAAVIMCLASYALVRLIQSISDARVLCLLAAVIGVLVHALLELPLEYAYFLLPTGLALGAAHALTPKAVSLRPVPVWVVRSAGAVIGLALGAVAVEYLQAEQSHRLLRLESARIGVTRIESTAPELHLLTQLSAFLEFARTEARPGMTTAQMEQMKRVSQRFAYPPSMFRYALAQGLNGQTEEASLTLRRLCSIHPVARCQEMRDAWPALLARYPQLATVRLP